MNGVVVMGPLAILVIVIMLFQKLKHGTVDDRYRAFQFDNFINNVCEHIMAEELKKGATKDEVEGKFKKTDLEILDSIKKGKPSRKGADLLWISHALIILFDGNYINFICNEFRKADVERMYFNGESNKQMYNFMKKLVEQEKGSMIKTMMTKQDGRYFKEFRDITKEFKNSVYGAFALKQVAIAYRLANYKALTRIAKNKGILEQVKEDLEKYKELSFIKDENFIEGSIERNVLMEKLHSLILVTQQG